jgi:uncharacterized SAM-binding protein YcdF (DUF218 family)
MPWDNVQKTEGEVLKEYAIKNTIPQENILITKDVENTADEAKAVKELIGSKKKIILVTSAFHMYRAKKLFEKQGFNIVTYKVDFKTTRNKVLKIMDFLPSAENLKDTEIGIRELFGRIFYFIKD